MKIFGITLGKEKIKPIIMLDDIKKLRGQYEKELNIHKNRIKQLEEENRTIIYNFDYLIEKWEIGKANAMVYKLINYWRNQNNPEIDTIERWGKRCFDIVNEKKKS